MINNINEYVEFLIKHQLTSSQFLLLYLVETQDVSNIRKYNTNSVQPFKDEEVEDLIDKGHLIYEPNSPRSSKNRYELENLVVSLEYKDIILKDPYKAAKEIWDAYPMFQIIDGNKKPSKNIDFDTFVEKYKRIVGKNILEHYRILRITKQVAEREEYAYFGIDKYISTKAYEAYEQKYAEQPRTVNREVI